MKGQIKSRMRPNPSWVWVDRRGGSVMPERVLWMVIRFGIALFVVLLISKCGASQ